MLKKIEKDMVVFCGTGGRRTAAQSYIYKNTKVQKLIIHAALGCVITQTTVVVMLISCGIPRVWWRATKAKQPHEVVQRQGVAGTIHETLSSEITTPSPLFPNASSQWFKDTMPL